MNWHERIRKFVRECHSAEADRHCNKHPSSVGDDDARFCQFSFIFILAFVWCEQATDPRRTIQVYVLRHVPIAVLPSYPGRWHECRMTDQIGFDRCT